MAICNYKGGLANRDHIHSVNLHEMNYIFHVNHLSKTFLFCIFANCLGFSVVSGIGLLIYGDN